MPKYFPILQLLRDQIAAGKYSADKRMPSENELAQRFRVSRPTAARAIRELVNLGLLERRIGSGTYLRRAPREISGDHPTFGLLVPGLGNTEILDPICNEITRFAQANRASVLWGDIASGGMPASNEEVERLCRSYIDQRVNGVFFAPIEVGSDRMSINARIVESLVDAGIAVTLLDRDVLDFPNRSRLDLVGIDNFNAGLTLGAHLLAVGHKKFRFVARNSYPPTTDLRIAGCREALTRHAIQPAEDWCRFGDPSDEVFVRKLLKSSRPDVIICSNDLTAALLIQTLTTALGLVLPRDLAVVGFDDVKYSTLLAVPLTTMRQPCRAIAQAAVGAMLARLNDPTLAPRQILLQADLVVRRSCGSQTT